MIHSRHAKRIELKVDNTEKNSMNEDNSNFKKVDTNDQGRGLYDKFKNNKKMVLFVVIIFGYVLYIFMEHINDNRVVKTEKFDVDNKRSLKTQVSEDDMRDQSDISGDFDKFD